MAASLDGFIAGTDGRVDWLETSDEFPGGETLSPEFVEAFLETIDCYVMGPRTYETALEFEARGLGWAYGDTPSGFPAKHAGHVLALHVGDRFRQQRRVRGGGHQRRTAGRRRRSHVDAFGRRDRQGQDNDGREPFTRADFT